MQMTTRNYTFGECYHLLSVDPKTFRRWLEKAEIIPKVSRSDSRIKYLTGEQVRELAEMHDRDLQPDEEQESVPHGAYKLLQDRLDMLGQELTDTREMIGTLQQRISDLETQLHQQSATAEQAARKPKKPMKPEGLPEGLVGWHSFANLHRVAHNDVRRLIQQGFIHVVRGQWKIDQAVVKEALDATGRHEFWVQFHAAVEFQQCDQCPH